LQCWEENNIVLKKGGRTVVKEELEVASNEEIMEDPSLKKKVIAYILIAITAILAITHWPVPF
jgi:hypothetical protein